MSTSKAEPGAPRAIHVKVSRQALAVDLADGRTLVVPTARRRHHLPATAPAVVLRYVFSSPWNPSPSNDAAPPARRDASATAPAPVSALAAAGGVTGVTSSPASSSSSSSRVKLLRGLLN